MIVFQLRHHLLFLVIAYCSSQDYYDLLGVTRDASNYDIKRAFKKLAVKFHPDKNKDDASAQSTFIRLAKAYETLKDAELRKTYDLYGEGGLNEKKHPNYHPWNYYHRNFGMYDDDLEVTTLNHADFEQMVLNSNFLWFINFYSPMCSHCHYLAGAWRQLAQEVDGVVRIGAVNCEEEWTMCNRENVRSYPSLILYPSRKWYKGERSAYALESFLLDNLPMRVAFVTSQMWKTQLKIEFNNIVLFICYEEEDCDRNDVHIKVAALLDGLADVGIIDCSKYPVICTEFEDDISVALWEVSNAHPEGKIHKMIDGNFKEISQQALTFLPETTDLNNQEFEELRAQLRSDSALSWLVYFYLERTNEDDLELKKLPRLLSNDVRVGRVNCGRETSLCAKLYLSKYPVLAVFKPGGGSEIYHGRRIAHDIANFVEESRLATNIQILSPEDFVKFRISNQDNHTLPWFVDFYAPWCPPCKRLILEFRKASREFESTVNFGTVDCTIHRDLCHQYKVDSYPTALLFNKTLTHRYYGNHNAENLVEFVEDFVRPVVMKLTEVSFHETVAAKTLEEIWVINFYAPWCGPCRQLSPHWKKLAKDMSYLQNLHVSEVDCHIEMHLCEQQSIKAFPTIRLYPVGYKGLSAFVIYSSYQRDIVSLKQWLYYFLPSTIEELTEVDFDKKVYARKEPWLINYFAPWCGHCVAFLPEFEEIAQKLEGKIHIAKVNCDSDDSTCQKAGITAYPTVVFYEPQDSPSYVGKEIESQTSEFILTYVEEALSKRRRHQHHDEF